MLIQYNNDEKISMYSAVEQVFYTLISIIKFFFTVKEKYNFH